MERIVSSLARAGIEEVYLAVNYKAKAFERCLGSGERFGVRIRYLREEKKLGTAGGLSLLAGPPAGPVVVTNADIVTRLDFSRLLEYHRSRGASMTVAGVEHVQRIPYGVLRTEGERLIGMEEKPEVRATCSAGIYVLDPEVLRFIPPGEALDMPELLAKVLAEGMAVYVFSITERWFDIGGPEEFQRVLIEFATGEEE